MPTLKIAKDLFDLLYPVGTYYETSNSNWTPSNAGWYGTWVEDTAGKTTVAKDSGTFKTLGGSVGSETHELTVDEMPSHNHAFSQRILAWDAYWPYGVATASYNAGPIQWQGYNQEASMTKTGGSQPHNNIQPSIVVRRWHRTA